MDEIIALARQLGNKIAEHARTKAFAAAAEAVNSDAQARQILSDYQALVTRLREVEGQGKTVETGDRKKLAELESKVASNEPLKAMMRTQADYLELMHRVNEAIDQGSQQHA